MGSRRDLSQQWGFSLPSGIVTQNAPAAVGPRHQQRLHPEKGPSIRANQQRVTVHKVQGNNALGATPGAWATAAAQLRKCLLKHIRVKILMISLSHGTSYVKTQGDCC